MRQIVSLLGLVSAVAALGMTSSAWANLLIVPTDVSLTKQDAPSVEPCFRIARIRIEGFAEVATAAEIGSLVKPLAFGCQGNGSITALRKALNSHFANNGLVTTQAWLPQQDMGTSHELAISVIPGRVDRIDYQEKPMDGPGMLGGLVGVSDHRPDSADVDLLRRIGLWLDGMDDDLDRLILLPDPARISMARTVSKDEILQIDTVQDTLDSLNRVASNKAKAELKPGARPATSVVVVHNQIKDTFRLYAGYDTESVEGFDQLRFGTTIEKDNLIGINDSWQTTLKTGAYSNDLSGSLTIPVGNHNISLNGSWTDALVNLSELSELYTTATTFGGGWNWIANSSKTQKSVFDLSLSRREQLRYVNGEPLTPQVLSVVSFGLTLDRYGQKGTVSGRLGASFGVPVLGASDDAFDATDTVPRTQFRKIEAGLSGYYVLSELASLRSSLSTQVAAHPLYSDDQMTLGSRSTVRGYSGGSIKVDSGAVWRNELVLTLPRSSPDGASSGQSWFDDVASRMNFYGFGDLGFGRDIANSRNPYRVSAGLGLRYADARLSFDVGYGFRLAEDDRTSLAMSPDRGELFFNLRFKAL